jgi:CBS domain-containing protein
MKIEKVMTRDVVTVAPTASLKEAAELMLEHRISGLPVVTGEGALVGVFSQADLLFKEQGPPESPSWLAWFVDPMAVADQPKLDAHVVGDAMTTPAQVIEQDQPVAAAAKIMLGTGINRLPVTKQGQLVGIVTRTDLVRAFTRTDGEIAAEISEEVLPRGTMIGLTDVKVEVAEGEVTLTGRVATRADRRTVPAQVAHVPGVVSVESKLTLADFQPLI